MSAVDRECLLPRQAPGSRQATKRSISVSRPLPDEWRNPDQLPRLVQLIKVSWSVLLGNYTGKQTPVFGYIESGNGKPGLHGDLTSQLRAHVEQWSLSSGNHGHEVKRLTMSSVQPWCNSCETDFLFDTWLWFRRKGDSASANSATHPCIDDLASDCALTILCDHDPHENTLVCSTLSSAVTSFSEVLLDSFVQVLGTVIGDPGAGGDRELSLLGPLSIDLVRKWNQPGLMATTNSSCIHTLILKKCKRQPLAPAVCAWDGALKYYELDQFSDTVARHLASRHIGPESVVPVCFEKSVWTAVAILGVLRAGAAFALLDPSYPLARLKSICEDIQPQLILTSRAQLALTQQLNETVLVLPDITQRHPPITRALRRPVTPHNAAYVAFTSGSTGKPKGVVIEHRSFCASALGNAPAQQLQPSSRVLQFASYGFDISIQEILTTLIVGGCICVPSEEQRLQDLAAAIRKLRVNWMELTPTVARRLHPDEVSLVRTVVLGGEPIQSSDVVTWSRGNQQRLLVAYGPAECTIVATVHRTPDAADPFNIGRSCSGTCWVVNPQDHHQLALLGATGELVIGGPIVGRGYINRPADASFITSPRWASQFQICPQARFYRTGDLVRYNIHDGTLQYCGRKDSQVKVQGQRVELHEIEQCAEAFHPETVAVAEILSPSRGPPRVALFLVDRCQGAVATSDSVQVDSISSTVDSGRRASFARLHQYLADRLARFMVPSLYIPLTHVPLLPTGKVDRRRLRNIVAEMPLPELKTYVSSVSKDQREMTKMEHVLHRLVVDQLQMPAGSVNCADSFFKLGGNSIMAINIVTRLRKQGWALSMSDFFSHQTIAALARVAVPVQPTRPIPAFSLMGDDAQTALRRAAEQCRMSEERILDAFPCTPVQEAMMYLSSDGGMDFTGTFAFQLPRDIDMNLFKRSWQQIVTARAILRTRLVRHASDEVYQVVTKDDPSWTEGLALEGVVKTINAYHLAFGQPLIRYGIAGQGPGGKGPLFVLRMHHAVFDGWSYWSLLDDVEQLYHGKSLPNREGMQQLLHYRARLDRTAAGRFWRDSFSGFGSPLFPAAPPGWVRPRRMAVKQRQISLSTTTPNAGYTTATVVQLAWAILQASRTGLDDVVFGTTVSGRNAPVPGIENLMGPTIATFPMRVALDPASTVQSTLEGIQSWMSSTIPFEQTGLVQIGQASPEAALACQFQTLLVIQPRPLLKQSQLLADVPQNQTQQHRFTSHILTIVVEIQEKQGVQVEAIFDGNVLDPWLIDHALGQFEGFVCRILDRPDATLDAIRGFTNCDREQIRSWNPEPTFQVSRVHDAIQSWLSCQPEAPAVSSWDGAFTYRELFEHARQWAAHLQVEGASPGETIAICMERSRWQIVAMLGVLIGGCAFMMLEPAFPPQRLRQMCSAGNVARVIASSTTAAEVDRIGLQTTVPTAELLLLAPRSCDASVPGPPSPDPHIPMYVAFTSGSTGLPKGIVIEHAMCHTSAQAYQASFALGKTSRVLYNSSVAFDAMILETMWTLLAGGCICIPSEEDRLGDLPRAMRHLKVNWAVLTPSVARMLSPAELPALDTLLLAGEAVSTADIDKWAGQVQLKVGYGPAECAVSSTTREVSSRTPAEPSNIGRCLNGRAWIVDPDSHHRLLPVGATGELLLSGAMVARGYLNNPAKSQASFVRGPSWGPDFGIAADERFYRTGDLVRYTADGTMVFMGRRDTQVKLHGQRIELQEIEQQAAQSLADQIAVAGLVPFKALTRSMLVLFLAPRKIGQAQPGLFEDVNEQNRLLAESLLASLRAVLAPYMVPSVVIPIAWLPLSPSGKTDRRLLLDKASQLSAERLALYFDTKTKSPQRGPSTPTQTLVRRIFADILKTPEDTLGIDQSFFEMGGNSLLAMQLLAACRKHDLAITMVDLLERKSIAVLSEQLEWRDLHPRPAIQTAKAPGYHTMCRQGSRLEHARRGMMSHVTADSIQDAFECPAPHVGIIADQLSNAGMHKQRCIWEIQSSGRVKVADVAYALEQVIQRHAMLRSVLLPWPGDPLRPTQVVLKSVDRVIQIWNTPPVQSPAALWSHKPVRCLEGSMPHHSILAEGPHGQVWWLFEFDKALIDAASMTILLHEIAALSLNRSCQMDPAPCYSQYAAFVNALQPAEAHLPFWKDTLRGIAPCLFPKSRGLPLRACGPPPRVRTIIKRINDSATLTGVSQASGLTVTNIFQTIWGLVLARTLHSVEVCFGTLKSCRDAAVPGILQMVGPVFNIVPCRLRFSSVHPTPDELLHTLRCNQAAMTDRTRHQHTSLQRILHATGQDCLFNTCLTVQPAMALDTPDQQPIHLKLLETYDPTEYKVVAAVILFHSHAELHIRYWDDFLSETDARCLRDTLCGVMAEVTAVLGSARASKRQRFRTS